MADCPRCGTSLRDDAAVCGSCLYVLDRERWQHDAGRLGADGRGGGAPLEDAPVGPVPLTAGSMDAGGAVGSGVRLWMTGRLLRWGRRR
jgi:hypothetical protein